LCFVVGAIALLQTSAGDGPFEFDFSLIELYGSAHLAFSGEGTKVKVGQVLGDDSGHLHLAPNQTMDMDMEMVQVTYALGYRNSTMNLVENVLKINPCEHSYSP
jgi:hypothetical protein